MLLDVNNTSIPIRNIVPGFGLNFVPLRKRMLWIKPDDPCWGT
jgi:hypothetical protein